MSDYNRNESYHYISNIQRFSVHDGPGIRTVVFLLGCPLRCAWCQNPEAINSVPNMMFNEEKCVGCLTCVNSCQEEAIFVDNSNKIKTDREKCNDCLECIDACVYGARQTTGEKYTISMIVNEVAKDRVFYENTGGGVTLSGGEPTLNIDFTYQLLRKCKEKGINTAVETCGLASWDKFESIFEVTDLFLYDIKVIDPEIHKNYTGVDNGLILENMKKIVQKKKEIIPRVPLIPKVNNNKVEFKKIIDFIKSLVSIETMHIMPFHQIGASKYKMLDLDYPFKEANEISDEEVEIYCKMAEQAGLSVNVGGGGEPLREKERKSTRNRMFLYDL